MKLSSFFIKPSSACVPWAALLAVLLVVHAVFDTVMLARSSGESTKLLKVSESYNLINSSSADDNSSSSSSSSSVAGSQQNRLRPQPRALANHIQSNFESSVTLTVVVSCMDIEIKLLVPHILKQCLGTDLSLWGANSETNISVKTILLVDPVCLDVEKKDFMFQQIEALKATGIDQSFVQEIDVVDHSRKYQRTVYQKYLGIGYGERVEILSTKRRLRPFLSYLYALETCQTKYCVILNSDVAFHNLNGRSWITESVLKLNQPGFEHFIAASPYTGIDPVNASYKLPGVIMRGSYDYNILENSTIQMNTFVSTRALMVRKESLMRILPFSHWSKDRGFEWHMVTEMKKRGQKLYMAAPFTSWMLHIATGYTKAYLLERKEMLPFFLSSFEQSSCFPPSQLCYHNIDHGQFWDWFLFCKSSATANNHFPMTNDYVNRVLSQCKAKK